MKVVGGKNDLKGLSLVEYNKSESEIKLTKMAHHTEENITKTQRTEGKKSVLSQVWLS